jgi:agmatine/peptidylarginine deiminase
MNLEIGLLPLMEPENAKRLPQAQQRQVSIRAKSTVAHTHVAWLEGGVELDGLGHVVSA